jgi:hypothetical protein
MSKERELLKRIANSNYGDTIPTHFIYEIEKLLAQPDLIREPLSEDQISELLMGGFSTHLMDLVRMIEKAHGIGVDNEII